MSVIFTQWSNVMFTAYITLLNKLNQTYSFKYLVHRNKIIVILKPFHICLKSYKHLLFPYLNVPPWPPTFCCSMTRLKLSRSRISSSCLSNSLLDIVSHSSNLPSSSSNLVTSSQAVVRCLRRISLVFWTCTTYQSQSLINKINNVRPQF